MEAEPKSLTYKQSVFVAHFAELTNATAAASLAGYSYPGKAGSNLLKLPHVRAAVEERLGKQLPAERTRYQASKQDARRLCVLVANGKTKLTYGDPEAITARLKRSLPCPVKLLVEVAPKDGEKAAGPLRERFRKGDWEWWDLSKPEREELLAAVQACAKGGN